MAPSPIAITGDEVHTPEGKRPYVVPRELADDELPAIVAGFWRLLEALEAVQNESPLVGLRISPLNSSNAILDNDPIGLSSWLAERLNGTGLDDLHVMRGDLLGQQHGDVLTPIRTGFRGVLVGNMGYSAEEANGAIATGQLNAVAFGNAFLANPDLPERFRRGAPLQDPDPATYYTAGPAGYTDDPFLEPA